MKSLLSITAVSALSHMLDRLEQPIHFVDHTPLPRSKKFTGARKIQRAAKKRRNRMRSGS